MLTTSPQRGPDLPLMCPQSCWVLGLMEPGAYGVALERVITVGCKGGPPHASEETGSHRTPPQRCSSLGSVTRVTHSIPVRSVVSRGQASERLSMGYEHG